MNDDRLGELLLRLVEKSALLDRMADEAHNFEESARLAAKADGVRLAISFIREIHP